MHPKFKFQNGGRIWKCSFKQSCRTWKVEQLLFLEIFNFFRKFVSNLQNGLSGNSVNIWKSVWEAGRHLLLAADAAELVLAGSSWRHVAACSAWACRSCPSLAARSFPLRHAESVASFSLSSPARHRAACRRPSSPLPRTVTRCHLHGDLVGTLRSWTHPSLL